MIISYSFTRCVFKYNLVEADPPPNCIVGEILRWKQIRFLLDWFLICLYFGGSRLDLYYDWILICFHQILWSVKYSGESRLDLWRWANYETTFGRIIFSTIRIYYISCSHLLIIVLYLCSTHESAGSAGHATSTHAGPSGKRMRRRLPLQMTCFRGTCRRGQNLSCSLLDCF